jgi:hypothetical protein
VSKHPPLTPEQIAAKRACPGMRVHDATRIYPLGRNKIYNLMNAGVLPFTKVGQTTILSTAGLEALVAPKAMT